MNKLHVIYNSTIKIKYLTIIHFTLKCPIITWNVKFINGNNCIYFLLAKSKFIYMIYHNKLKKKKKNSKLN